LPQHRIGKLDGEQVRALAREVLSIEADAVAKLAERIGDEFVRAVELCLACRGRIVVIGMGKSGHVGNKLAATLASTGSPAFFVHPSEASHGDLGMITGEDLVVALSNSGETAELVTLLPLIKRLGVPLIALTGKDSSTLARAATVHLEARVEKEACPMNLAPTASTTAALALGDALAVALLQARGFTKEDFARSHPGGSLGRRLLLTVADLMHSGDAIPRVAPDALLSAALLEMTHKRLGMTAICDAGGKLLGVFTDGDLRRALDQGTDVRSARIDAVMTRGPKVGRPEMLAGEALELMDSKRINGLLVVDADGRLVGALGMHDLLRAGIV
jgi:arabinose-5-phosphate isomerase